jgi:hypothetical protein
MAAPKVPADGVGEGAAVDVGVGTGVGVDVGGTVAVGDAVGVTVPEPYTSNSAICPPVAPVLAVNFNLTYLTEAAANVTDTVLPETGLKE